MTNEEIERTMQFILEQQASTSAKLDRMADIQAADAVRIGRLEDVVTTLTTTVQNLVSVVQTQSERMDSSDDRVNRLAETVDRYIKARGDGGNGRG